MKFAAFIPARYASTRFPAKPLAILGGKPVIQRVCEQASKVFDQVFVATDDERIEKVVKNAGYNAVMTRADHKSGTDRCYEAFLKSGSDAQVVVNIQGDEPFIRPSQLITVRDLFNDTGTDIATLVKPFANDATFEKLSNPNSPKVVVDDNWNALYFSRSVIPYLRGVPEDEWASRHTFYKHIGLYAFRSDVLARITSLPQAPLEKAESLEQLRWLSAGFSIRVGVTQVETIGIDTPQDLAAAESFLQQGEWD
ncbi:MAG: 3-deoxy-manno-octulosonate cytidylyltransferase [Bacteroidaceae bacterium]|nr:3-deoxy-manno-octulosonate cytidylyltransferase [Bacteroidaceae bacterium]